MIDRPTQRSQARAHAADEPLTRDMLVDFFAEAERPDRSTHKVGTELEKFGVRVPTGAGDLLPIDYGDVAHVLAGLCDRFGWQPGPDRGPGGEIIELRRDGASITLEPGGQFELSGKPLTTVHETCAEFTQHYRELHAVSEPLSLSWFTAGFHPWAKREQLNWMPKGRYKVMREFLPTRGGRGLDMMLRTCTVQANFDYTSEANCGERLRIANAIAPVVCAMFANSPFVEGRDTGLRTARSTVWTDVDNARCGTPAFVWEPFSYEKYVDWALAIPMFFVKRDGTYHPHHPTFMDFMRDGFTTPDGQLQRAQWSDWVLHLSTVFPEVRLKPFIEFRSADAVPSKWLCALPALLKGLLYDDDVGAQTWALFAGMDAAEREQLWFDARHAGMAEPRLQNLAVQLVALARTSLERANVRDEKGRTEARFLDPLQTLVDAGQCPADVALAQVGAELGEGAWSGPKAQRAFVRPFYFAGTEP
ncbi:MAG TPA: glutamate-cysteine ligase family protein [Nannocystaceae bacterium]|nr:glutamate-cysteine ligase family protein [Nannocystaceae bacterium]